MEEGAGRRGVNWRVSTGAGPVDALIVDDDVHICKLIREELCDHGVRCTIATSPMRAADLIRRRHFDLVITDISMPGLSGLELLEFTRRHAPAAKVVLITGVCTQEYLAEAVTLGAYDYIEKPFRSGQLVEVVERAVRDARGQRQLPAGPGPALRLWTHAERAALDSVWNLVCAVEAKDPYTRRHSEHVARYAGHLARGMGVAADTLDHVRIASLLHDLGKIRVPNRILIKPGRLTDEEIELVRRHPAAGADILAKIDLLTQEADLVRYHHEACGGTGYPDGLAGDQIPLGSRIIHVADAIDAMLMERSYKAAYPMDATMNELARCAGKQFDPEVVAVALQWCRSNREQLHLPALSAPAA